jgi:hypothetical protein
MQTFASGYSAAASADPSARRTVSAVAAITFPPARLKRVKALAARVTRQSPHFDSVSFGVPLDEAETTLGPGQSSSNCLSLEPTARLFPAGWAVAAESESRIVYEYSTAAVAVGCEVNSAVDAPSSPAKADSKRPAAGCLSLYPLRRHRSACLCNGRPGMLEPLPDVPASHGREDSTFSRLVDERILYRRKDGPRRGVDGSIRQCRSAPRSDIRDDDRENLLRLEERT